MIRILQATCESRLFFYIYPTLIRTLSPSTQVLQAIDYLKHSSVPFGIFFGSIYLCRIQLLSLSCIVSILVVDDIHMVVMGLLLIFGEICLGLSIFYVTFVSYYYRWQTPLCSELCDLHCRRCLSFIISV